jgi:hypothetical protein
MDAFEGFGKLRDVIGKKKGVGKKLGFGKKMLGAAKFGKDKFEQFAAAGKKKKDEVE